MQSIKDFLTIEDKELSPYEQKKVNQLNVINACYAVIAFVLAAFNLFLHRYTQLIIEISLIGTIFLPAILLQKKGHYVLGRNYFTLSMLFIMTTMCIINISSGEFLQTQNIYLTLAPALVILYERIQKVILYVSTIALFFTMHVYDYMARGIALDSSFFTNSMVYLAVLLAIYYFVGSYKDAFFRVYLEQLELIRILEKQKDELEDTNETKNKLFSIVAHDLKRPMHMLTGLLQMEGKIPESELKNYRNQVKESVEGINSLIENVLTWAKSQLEGFHINIQQTELNQLFSTEIDVFKEQAYLKGIALTSEIPKDLNIFSDPNHISLIIRNIINNSIKFTPPEGQISITARECSDHVDIIIKDTGIGMDEETIEKIQNQKFVSSKNGTQGESGSGLGLVLCTETLNKIGGKLLIESIMGKGSQFIIHLPLN